VNAKTIPIRFGPRTAGVIIIGALALSVLASGFLPLISPARLGLLYVLASVLLGYFLTSYRSTVSGTAGLLTSV
jgi:4-hydroxybenzoate polyprenyltransferase